VDEHTAMTRRKNVVSPMSKVHSAAFFPPCGCLQLIFACERSAELDKQDEPADSLLDRGRRLFLVAAANRRYHFIPVKDFRGIAAAMR
jgi:hypothetical protein